MKKAIIIISVILICVFSIQVFKIKSPILPDLNSVPSIIPTYKSSYINIAGVGDIFCAEQNLGNSCQQAGIAKLINNLNPQAVLIPGDSQYDKGTYDEYRKYFESFLGKYKKIIYPSPGNHDYSTPKASGYFDYFNGVGKSEGMAGLRDKGYYSFNLGSWHIISLNSNCTEIGGCQKGSVQEKWLLSDLQKSRQPCTLAFWHEPLFSSGPHGNNLKLKDIWTDLYDYRADIILNGHDHDYERFKKQDPAGKADDMGIREFVIGTGGSLLYRFMNIEKNSEIRDASSHGILELKLYSDKYSWTFQPVLGDSFKDTGSTSCNLKKYN